MYQTEKVFSAHECHQSVIDGDHGLLRYLMEELVWRDGDGKSSARLLSATT